MNGFHVDDRFSDALRAELVAQVDAASTVRSRRKTRLWLSGSALAGACLLGGIGAAAAGLFHLPGGQEITPLAAPVTENFAGTGTVELGDRPDGATGIEMKLTALSPGRFEFPDGGSCSFTDADINKVGGYASCSGTLPLEPGQDGVTIKTAPDSRWELTAKYVKQVRTELGVNAKGETYGVESPEHGVPDLIAVMATNGSSGYAYANDLYGGPMPTSPEDAAKNFSTPRPPREIPVFLSDGETKVGIFLASGSGGGVPSYPTASPRP